MLRLAKGGATTSKGGVRRLVKGGATYSRTPSQPDQAPAPVGETKDGFFTNDALTQYGENGDLAHGLVNPLLLDPRAFNEKLDSLSSDETAQDDDSGSKTQPC